MGLPAREQTLLQVRWTMLILQAVASPLAQLLVISCSLHWRQHVVRAVHLIDWMSCHRSRRSSSQGTTPPPPRVRDQDSIAPELRSDCLPCARPGSTLPDVQRSSLPCAHTNTLPPLAFVILCVLTILSKEAYREACLPCSAYPAWAANGLYLQAGRSSC